MKTVVTVHLWCILQMQCVHVETLELSFVPRFILTVSTVTPHCCRLLKQCLSTTCSYLLCREAISCKPSVSHTQIYQQILCPVLFFWQVIVKDIFVSGALWIWLVGSLKSCLLNLTADIFLSRCLEEEAGVSSRPALHSISAPPVVQSQRLQQGATFSSWIVEYALRHVWFCYIGLSVCVFK